MMSLAAAISGMISARVMVQREKRQATGDPKDRAMASLSTKDEMSRNLQIMLEETLRRFPRGRKRSIPVGGAPYFYARFTLSVTQSSDQMGRVSFAATPEAGQLVFLGPAKFGRVLQPVNAPREESHGSSGGDDHHDQNFDERVELREHS